MIKLHKIEGCYEKIKSFLSPTRLEKSIYLSSNESPVYLKLENEQPIVKAFKIRGVLGKLVTLSEEDIKGKEIAAITSGNHGVALAYCAKMLGLKSPIIFAPETAPQPKIDKMKYFGASVIQIGKIYDETHMMADEIISEKGYIKIDSREDELGVVGQGSIAIEIIDQMPNVDAVIVPMGSGGMSIAIASYFKQEKPNVKVYAVEAENSPALVENLKSGIWTETFEVNSDGNPLLKSLVGGCAKLTFENAEVLEDIFLVSDEDAKIALSEIVKHEKVIVEPDSAVVYAAYKNNAEIFKGKNTVLVISGGNVDDDIFKQIILEYY